MSMSILSVQYLRTQEYSFRIRNFVGEDLWVGCRKSAEADWKSAKKLPFDNAGLAVSFPPAEIAIEKPDETWQAIPVTRELLDYGRCCLYIAADGRFALVAGSKLCPWCLANFRAVSELRFSKSITNPTTCNICEFGQHDTNRAFGHVRDAKRFSLVEWQRLQALRNVSTLVFSNKTNYRLTVMNIEDKVIEPYQERTLVFPTGKRTIYGGRRDGVETWRSRDIRLDFAGKRYHFVIEKKTGNMAKFFNSLGELDVAVRFEGTEEYGQETDETRKADPETYNSRSELLDIDRAIESLVPPAERQLKKIIIGGIHVGDNFINHGTAGAMGPNSTGTVHQTQNIAERADLRAEIAQLLVALKERAQTPGQSDAVRAVAEAETELRENNGAAAISKLARAGTWALGIAKEIGTKLAVEALEKSAGLK